MTPDLPIHLSIPTPGGDTVVACSGMEAAMRHLRAAGNRPHLPGEAELSPDAQRAHLFWYQRDSGRRIGFWARGMRGWRRCDPDDLWDAWERGTMDLYAQGVFAAQAAPWSFFRLRMILPTRQPTLRDLPDTDAVYAAITQAWAPDLARRPGCIDRLERLASPRTWALCAHSPAGAVPLALSALEPALLSGHGRLTLESHIRRATTPPIGVRHTA